MLLKFLQYEQIVWIVYENFNKNINAISGHNLGEKCLFFVQIFENLHNNYNFNNINYIKKLEKARSPKENYLRTHEFKNGNRKTSHFRSNAQFCNIFIILHFY